MARLGNTSSADNWAPLPEGQVLLEIVQSESAEPSARFPKTPRVYFQYEVPNEAKSTVETETAEGQEQSYRIREYFGETLGTPTRRSRLYDRIASILGSKYTPVLERWLSAGGEFDYTWTDLCRIKAIITHTFDPQGQMWANISGVVPDKNLAAASARRIFACMHKDDPALLKQVIGNDAPPPAQPVSAKAPAKAAVAVAEPDDDLPF